MFSLALDYFLLVVFATVGLLQVAAALIHYRDRNQAGAEGMIAKAKDKLRRCRERGVETPLLERDLDWARFRGLVEGVPDPPEFADFDELHGFKFPDPGGWGPP